MLSENHWFTEKCEEGGSAFSMKIRGRLHQEQTPFQRIEIFATEYFGNAMVIDGFVMLTEKDNFIYHEMMSHPALFWHPQPTYPSGWWTATLACKDAVLGDFRQPDADRRPFGTRYYNTAIHHAAMAAPEFFEKELKA